MNPVTTVNSLTVARGEPAGTASSQPGLVQGRTRRAEAASGQGKAGRAWAGTKPAAHQTTVLYSRPLFIRARGLASLPVTHLR